MRSLFFVQPHTLEFRDVPEPRIEHADDALVRPIVMTTCDIDPIIIAGRLPMRGAFPLGHEAIAEVVAVGEGVKSLRPGDRVILSYYDACGRCVRCGSHRPSRCLTYSPDMANRTWHGVGQTQTGYFSDLVRVPSADYACTPFPSDLDPTHLASLGDNIGFAYEFVAPHLAARPGSDVLVMGGGGSIAIYAAAFAVAAGARTVVYSDWDPHRLTLAERYGATAVSGPAPKQLGKFPVVVDASANTDSLLCAIRSTDVEGQLSSVGGHFAPAPLPLFEMYLRGINYYTGPGFGIPNIAGAIGLIRAKEIDFSHVTSLVAPFAEAAGILREPPLKAVFTA